MSILKKSCLVISRSDFSKSLTYILRKTKVAYRQKQLYSCALSVEKDQTLNQEMQDWEVTVKDGLKDIAD